MLHEGNEDQEKSGFVQAQTVFFNHDNIPG